MPVLGTKLHVPAMRRRLVPRPRLTGRLRGDPASASWPRLVLVSAPAITLGIREAALARPDGDDLAVSLLRIRGLADRYGFGHRCFLAC